MGKWRREREREIVNKRRLTLGLNNGMLKVFPPLWEFPKMTLKKLIENWYVGNQREKVLTLAFLDAKYVCHIATRKKN